MKRHVFKPSYDAGEPEYSENVQLGEGDLSRVVSKRLEANTNGKDHFFNVSKFNEAKIEDEMIA